VNHDSRVQEIVEHLVLKSLDVEFDEVNLSMSVLRGLLRKAHAPEVYSVLFARLLPKRSFFCMLRPGEHLRPSAAREA
jgi:hypothetical protein